MILLATHVVPPITASTPDRGEIKLNKGLVFLKEKDILVSGDKWTIVMDFEIEEYKQVLAHIETEIRHIKDFINSPKFMFTSIFPRVTTKPRNALVKAIERAEDAALRLADKVDEINKELFYTETGARKKRGLVNLGGHTLKFLFGSMDSDDMERIDSQLRNLNKAQHNIVDLVETQLTYLQRLDEQVHENRQDLKAYAKFINQTITSIQVRIAESINGVLNATTLLSDVLNALTNLQFITDTLSELEHQVMQFRGAIDVTATGKLSSYLVPPHLFANLLSRIALKLPDSVSLLSFVESSTIFMYYSIAQVHALASENKLRIFIDIPLKSPDRYFELYRVKELPYINGTSKLSEIGSNVIIPDYPYFAITSNRLYYALLEERDVYNCHSDSYTLCPADFVVFSATQPHCLAALFLGQPTSALETCDRRIIGHQRSPIWYRLPQRNFWIYSVPTVTKLTKSCMYVNNSRANTETVSIHNTGILEASANCYFYSQNFKLFPHNTGNIHASYKTNDIVIPEVNNDLFSLDSLAPEITLDQIKGTLPTLKDFHTDGLTMHIIEDKLREVTNSVNMTGERDNHSISFTIILVICILIGLFFIIQLIQCCKKKPHLTSCLKCPKPGVLRRVDTRPSTTTLVASTETITLPERPTRITPQRRSTRGREEEIIEFAA